jgi:hypothetical protein
MIGVVGEEIATDDGIFAGLCLVDSDRVLHCVPVLEGRDAQMKNFADLLAGTRRSIPQTKVGRGMGARLGEGLTQFCVLRRWGAQDRPWGLASSMIFCSSTARVGPSASAARPPRRGPA